MTRAATSTQTAQLLEQALKWIGVVAAGIQQPTRLTCEWVGQPALSMRNEHAVAVWTYLRYTSLRYHRHQHSNRCVLCTYFGSSMINFAMGGRGGKEGGGPPAPQVGDFAQRLQTACCKIFNSLCPHADWVTTFCCGCCWEQDRFVQKKLKENVGPFWSIFTVPFEYCTSQLVSGFERPVDGTGSHSSEQTLSHVSTHWKHFSWKSPKSPRLTIMWWGCYYLW